MESMPPAQSTTLASLLNTERVLPAPRARALLAALSEATSVPPAPAAPLEWLDLITITPAGGTSERASFREVRSSTNAIDAASRIARQVEALRIAAVCMLWGTASASDQPPAEALAAGPPAKFPRLRSMLWDQWDATRANCTTADRFMMFFDATLALDRAAEPKVGRDPFMTLGMQSTGPMKKGVPVGTIGLAFEAITDTGKFRKAVAPAPVEPPPPPPPEASSRSTMIIFAVAIIIAVAAVFGYRFLTR
jgi:hypothetical protein